MYSSLAFHWLSHPKGKTSGGTLTVLHHDSVSTCSSRIPVELPFLAYHHPVKTQLPGVHPGSPRSSLLLSSAITPDHLHSFVTPHIPKNCSLPGTPQQPPLSGTQVGYLCTLAFLHGSLSKYCRFATAACLSPSSQPTSISMGPCAYP